MSVWATVLEEGTPIPFLGLEAAPRDCPTTADASWRDSQRMIRIDAYRLATVVEAYVRCVKGFFMRIYLEQPSALFAERQSDMIGRLGDATSRLEEVLDERQRNYAKTKADKTPVEDQKALDNELDVRIVAYINKTIEDAKEVVRGLRMPLR